MKLAKWLESDDINDFPILGLSSFDTFIKVCMEFSKWMLDDIGLANRNDCYKIWISPVKSEKLSEVKSILERYTSMKLLLHYYNTNIVENNKIAFYIKLDYTENKWVMSYGITNDKKLFKVGEFEFNFNTQLNSNEILKYVLDYIQDFDPRLHLLLYKIKQDSHQFNPGYCQILDPLSNDFKVTISTNNLGLWMDNNKLQAGELDRLFIIFKDFVKEQKWASLVNITIRPRPNSKWIDFIIEPK